MLRYESKGLWSPILWEDTLDLNMKWRRVMLNICGNRVCYTVAYCNRTRVVF